METSNSSNSRSRSRSRSQSNSNQTATKYRGPRAKFRGRPPRKNDKAYRAYKNYKAINSLIVGEKEGIAARAVDKFYPPRVLEGGPLGNSYLTTDEVNPKTTIPAPELYKQVYRSKDTRKIARNRLRPCRTFSKKKPPANSGRPFLKW